VLSDLLLEGIYRLRGQEFAPLDTVGLASHKCNGNWLFVTSHEISHATETYASPPTRVWLPQGRGEERVEDKM
jgi:hypothetical protein